MLKNRKFIAIAVILIIASSFLVYHSFTISRNNTYEITAIFDPVNKTITAVQKTFYVNKSDVTFGELFFHIYPNAFSSEKTAPFLPDEFYKAYPEGFAPGWIQIKSVRISGKNVPFKVEGKDNTILKLSLLRPLKSGKSIPIYISYVIKLPPSVGRFGYGRYTYNITNWYPIACVYDDKGWHKDPYYILGDPFYSDVANYRVLLRAPAGYVVASTGDIKSISIDGDIKSWSIVAENVRDFAMIISNKFKVVSEKVDGITVKSYYFSQDDFGRRALKYARDALKFFSEYIGPYPYKQYSVVQADFYVGGMEYPNLVMIDGDLYTRSNIFDMEYVIAHETAHQWWYGIVGNDEVNEAWLDEGLTEYSTILYLERYYGKSIADNVFSKAIERPFEEFIASAKNTCTLRSLPQFERWEDYINLTYNKGAVMYSRLRKLVGDNIFNQILREYYSEYRYKNATTQDLIDVATKVYGKDLGGFFQEWLY
ncbi:Peptidase family M1 [Caldanaerobius fijiensis DSM 17918]|uniref:Peptidase family M1 n=1 Tax=Caldanaerobius fijiensis DSM 17918 TaxID=1121256 RepID=A0A1M4XB34_9THEO|nr:M1 family metallopeptidase [Caldanaerobius fijiensis]SHE90556.1 Peptidase family M1 [Caldanaerobius fijiensis DSM 17918]